MAQPVSIIDQRKKEGLGKALTLLLSLEFIVSVFSILSAVYTFVFIPKSFTLLGDGLRAVGNIIDLAILYGILKWKKIAIYGLIAYFGIRGTTLLPAIHTLLILSLYLNNSDWAVVLLYLIFFTWIWLWAIRRKWHLFT